MKFFFGSDSITVNVVQKAALWKEVRARFAARNGFAIATVNLDHLVKLATNIDFRRAYNAHDFIVADGNPIVWMSRLAGRRVALIPGSELILPLSKIAAETQTKIALVGSTPKALQDAADALLRDIPDLEIEAQIAPEFGFDPDSDSAAQIYDALNAAGVGLCFLALSAPKQEQFAARGRALAPQVGFVSIGAGLDFIAGLQIRAPKWVRAIAMEWAWRLLLNPRRLIRRYISCFRILPTHLIASWRQR